jgi:hypothetical protein
MLEIYPIPVEDGHPQSHKQIVETLRRLEYQAGSFLQVGRKEYLQTYYLEDNKLWIEHRLVKFILHHRSKKAATQQGWRPWGYRPCDLCKVRASGKR